MWVVFTPPTEGGRGEGCAWVVVEAQILGSLGGRCGWVKSFFCFFFEGRVGDREWEGV